jgi:branched-chain amino acid transport system substrate-binding protein
MKTGYMGRLKAGLWTNLWTVLWVGLLMCLLTACENRSLAQERSYQLAQSKGDVVIAVAWPLQSGKKTLVDGIDLAVDEINQRGGILGGRQLRIVKKDDESSLTKGRLVAQEIVNNLEVAAVIGHLNTYIAAPAASIYEQAGLLMVTPGASGQKITETGSKLVFRSLPGNRDQGRQIADYAVAQGYRSVALYYIKNDYGVDLANYFEQRANEVGISIADRRSYNMGGDNYAAILADWASFLKFDAIFLVGSLPESAQIVREARNAGIKRPIFGGAGLDSPLLITAGGSFVEGTVVFSLFNKDDPRTAVADFNVRFKDKFGKLPDSTAAQGYDTLNLLAQAMTRAQSVQPMQVANALRNTKGWLGVTGQHTFDEKGDLVAKPLSKMIVKNGRFVPFDLNTELNKQAPKPAQP